MLSVNINEIRNLGPFAPVYKWGLEFLKNPLPLSDRDLSIRCLSTEVPRSTNQSIDIQLHGHHVKQPGISDSSHTITMAFAENITNEISNALKVWREMCWRLKEGAAEYKMDLEAVVKITLLDQKDLPRWYFILHGVYLEDYDPIGTQLDGVTSDIQRPTWTLSYDYFEDGAL